MEERAAKSGSLPISYLGDICQVKVAPEDGRVVAVLHLDDDLRLVNVLSANRSPVLGQDRQDVAVLRLPVESLVYEDNAGLVIDAETGGIRGSDEEVEDLAFLASIRIFRLDLKINSNISKIINFQESIQQSQMPQLQ